MTIKWPWVSRKWAEERDGAALDRFDKIMEMNHEILELKGRLAKIAAMETPNCASIGKRMARIAKDLD